MREITPLYRCWSNMKQRCSPTNTRRDAKYYVLKGITVCDEWQKFDPFEKWALANGYQYGLTIERIDSNGNYEPCNCTFVTMAQQQRNKSNNIRLEYKGITKTLGEWATEYGLPWKTLRSRIDLGYSISEALEKRKGVLKTSPLYDYEGDKISLTEVSFLAKTNKSNVFKKIKDGWSISQIIQHYNNKQITSKS